MAIIDKTQDDTETICWARGDSDAKGFEVQDSAKVAVNIAGFSFKLTVNLERQPADQDNEQFTVVGVITDAPNGKVAFSPTVLDTDIAPGTYYYDVEQTNGAGAIKTLVVAKAVIVQDITKV